MVCSPNEYLPPFAESAPNPALESVSTYRPPPTEATNNPLPQFTSSPKPAPIEATGIPLPESASEHRSSAAKSLNNPLPEIISTRRPLPIEAMGNPLPEPMPTKQHADVPMYKHGDSAIAIATSARPPFSPSEDSPPSYEDSLQPIPTSSPPFSLPQHLQKPIVIPATTGKLGSPFLRCYAPVLSQYNLPKDVFLRHLDALNEVAVASPPLQILEFAGDAAGSLHLPAVGLLGGLVSAAARAGTRGVSYGRTEMFLKQLNKDIFGPRGLRIEIAGMKAVAKLANMPVLDADGRLAPYAKLLNDLQPHELESTTGQERRLRALTPWIEELEAVPLSQQSSNMFQAMSKRDLKQQEKRLKNQRKRHHSDYNEKLGKMQDEFDKETDNLDEKETKLMREEKMEKREEKLERLMRKRERVLQEFGAKKRELSQKRGMDDQEEQEMRKTKWIVITATGEISRLET